MSTITRRRGPAKSPAWTPGTGQLESHCSQCGVDIEGSAEFCQVCAIEASGGDVPPELDQA